MFCNIIYIKETGPATSLLLIYEYFDLSISLVVAYTLMVLTKFQMLFLLRVRMKKFDGE